MSSILKLGVLWVMVAGQMFGQGVSTRAYDNARSGWTPGETTLTQASVTTKGLVLQTTIPLCCDARGMEAQPLIVPGVTLKGGAAAGQVHDVLIAPSMSNVVRGVDAATGAGLWQTDLGTPITGSAQIDFHQINQHWGCLSTGVVVPATGRVYLSCWISGDGSGTPASGRYFLFVLNVADGSQVAKVALQGTDAAMWKQRSALVLVPELGTQGTIFLAHGSVYETANGYTGGIVAFDIATNQVTATLPLSSGIWMAGQGLVADAQGRLYAITGNGDFDPAKGWYGESFIRVTYTPSSGTQAAKLAIAPGDVWSPWTDVQRAGQAAAAATKLAGMSAPSEAVKPVGGGMAMPLANAKLVATMNDRGQPMVLAYPVMAKGAWADEDWGSAGPACIFAIAVCVATGKDGIGYPISTTNLGGTTLATVSTKANYAKLSAPCAWLTMSPGPVACDPTDPTTLNFFPWGDTAHLHMTPVQMYDPVLQSWTIFVWGENGQLHKWKVGGGSPGAAAPGALTYVAQGREFASADARGNPPGGMPGGFCSGSGTGETSLLLFCSIPYGDANANVVNGRLLVYDPVHLGADGSLQVLWDSQRWGIPYVYNKFMTPTVWNGRVYLPNYQGGVMMFGLGQ